MDAAPLGGLGPARFLREHWQKRPLLVRGALPGLAQVLTPQALMALARSDAVESRLVLRRGQRWQVRRGPFTRADFARLPARNWTLLVQGVNEHFAPGAELLARFDFVPHARLDDLMVSYAPDGGGVGPHFDSYDVFLIQGLGQRRWRISTQRELALVPDAPLKILQRFVAEDEWVLDPGDMLYLPPRCAHDGVAVGACTTWSVGFRAPAAQELAEHFLDFLRDRVALDGLYADPDVKLQREPAVIGKTMVDRVEQMLAKLRWGRREVAQFLGEFLSEPKPHVFFEPPARPLSHAAFAKRAGMRGLRLDLRTRLLIHGRTVFINGFAHPLTRGVPRPLRDLANRRRIAPGAALPDALLDLLHEWYLQGAIAIGQEHAHE